VVTYLDLINDARGRQKETPMSSFTAQGTGGEALAAIQATNKVLNYIRRNSVDLDITDKVSTITTVSGTATLTSPVGNDAWSPNLINRIVLDKSNGSYVDIPQVDLERAKELEDGLTTNDSPLFFYVNQGVVKLIPTPNAAYTLQVFYQTLLTRITGSNITDTVLLPEDFHEIMVDGIFAELRRAKGDTEWPAYWSLFEKSLSSGYIRNKYGLKKRGKRLFRMRASRDRNL